MTTRAELSDAEGYGHGHTPLMRAALEGPDDVHLVTRNASSIKPAKFVVLLIKDKSAPVLVPIQE